MKKISFSTPPSHLSHVRAEDRSSRGNPMHIKLQSFGYFHICRKKKPHNNVATQTWRCTSSRRLNRKFYTLPQLNFHFSGVLWDLIFIFQEQKTMLTKSFWSSPLPQREDVKKNGDPRHKIPVIIFVFHIHTIFSPVQSGNISGISEIRHPGEKIRVALSILRKRHKTDFPFIPPRSLYKKSVFSLKKRTGT